MSLFSLIGSSLKVSKEEKDPQISRRDATSAQRENHEGREGERTHSCDILGTSFY